MPGFPCLFYFVLAAIFQLDKEDERNVLTNVEDGEDLVAVSEKYKKTVCGTWKRWEVWLD